MGTTPLIPVEEYLATAYSPDQEYVEGVLVERKVGDWLHGTVQSNLIFTLRSRYPRLKVIPELRSQIATNRYRLPDVAVTLAAPAGLILTEAPYIAIEILSKDDSMSAVLEKLAEYAAIGTPNIWLFDPRLQRMYTYRTGVLEEVPGETIATSDGAVALPRAEIFAE